jgi:flagellar biosynthesis/type III secretory pathway chaperone
MTNESTSKRRCHRRLYQLLAEDVEQLELLQCCMNSIGAAIVRRDQPRLRRLLSAQSTLMEEMEARGEERRALVEAMGFESDAEGVESAIRWCDDTGQLYAIWVRLSLGASACTSEQGACVAILNQCQSRLREALNAMLGARRICLPRRPASEAHLVGPPDHGNRGAA